MALPSRCLRCCDHIPPLAWVPAAIIFWPTQELSIAFVTFLGAFFTIVINVIGGAQSIDVRYFQAARSMGSSTVRYFSTHNPSGRITVDRRWRDRRYWHHLGSGCRSGNDLWRRQCRFHGRRCGRRIGFLYLEFLCWGILHPNRCRHDQYWRRWLHVERHSPQNRAIGSLPGSRKAKRAMQMFHTKLSALPHSTAQVLGSQVVVSNVSKSYGADAFAKQVVHNCSFTRSSVANRDCNDRSVRLRQEHFDYA